MANGYWKIYIQTGPSATQRGWGDLVRNSNNAGRIVSCAASDVTPPDINNDPANVGSFILTVDKWGNRFDFSRRCYQTEEAAHNGWRQFGRDRWQVFKDSLDNTIIDPRTTVISLENEQRGWLGWKQEGDPSTPQCIIPGIEGWGSAEGWQAYYTALAVLEDADWQYYAFSYSGGLPEFGVWETGGMRAYLELCQQHPDRLGVALHEYSFNDNLFNGVEWGSKPIDAIGTNVFRFKHLYNACDSMGIARPNIFIKEFGWHERKLGDNQESSLHEAAEVYAQYPQILGVALWSVQKGWGEVNREVEALIPFMEHSTLTEVWDIGDAPPIDPPAPTNIIRNGSFESPDWSGNDPNNTDTQNWHTLIGGNQQPHEWSLSWTEPGNGRTYQGVRKKAYTISASPECRLMACPDHLPTNECKGEPDALVLDGFWTYKHFKTASWVTALSQSATGLIPGKKVVFTFPFNCHFDGRGENTDNSYDSEDTLIELYINNEIADYSFIVKEGENRPEYLTDKTTESRTWGFLTATVTVPANGTMSYQIVCSNKWPHPTSFFLDGFSAYYEQTEPPQDDPRANLCDVSYAQGQINYDIMKSQGVKGVFIRAGQGVTADTWFDINWQNAKYTIDRIGAYWYFRNDMSADAQAEALIDTLIAGQFGHLPLVVDLEDKNNAQFNTYKILKFIDLVEIITGRKMAIYTSKYYWDTPEFWDDTFDVRHAIASGRGLWTANWTDDKTQEPAIPSSWSTYEFWQWSADNGLGADYGAQSDDIDLNVSPLNDEQFLNKYSEFHVIAPDKPKVVIFKAPQKNETTEDAYLDICEDAWGEYGRTVTMSIDDMITMLEAGNDKSYAVVFDYWLPSQIAAIDALKAHGFAYELRAMSAPPDPLAGLQLGRVFRDNYVLTDKFLAPRDYEGGKHEGADYDVLTQVSNSKDDVLALYDGVVTFSSNALTAYGWYIKIKHEYNGYEFFTWYAHNDANYAVVGQRVKKGDAIAEIGASGGNWGEHSHINLVAPNHPAAVRGLIVDWVLDPDKYTDRSNVPNPPTGTVYNTADFMIPDPAAWVVVDRGQHGNEDISTRFENGEMIRVKNGQQAEWYSADGQWRIRDTSPADDPMHGPALYLQYTSGVSGGRIAPGQCRIGEKFTYKSYVQFKSKNDCRELSNRSGFADSTFELLEVLDNYTFPGGLTFDKVFVTKQTGENQLYGIYQDRNVGWIGGGAVQDNNVWNAYPVEVYFNRPPQPIPPTYCN